MRALSPREKSLGSALLAIVAAGVLFLLLIEPQLDRHAQLSEESTRTQEHLALMHDNIKRKDQIEEQFKSLRGLIGESGSPSQEQSAFAMLLAELSGSLKTGSVSPKTPIEGPSYRKYIFQVEMEGSTSEIIGFMNAVASAQKPIRIERAELTCKDRADYLTASFLISKLSAATDTPDRHAGSKRRVVQPRKAPEM